MDIELSESAGEVVGDADVVCVDKEVLESEVEREEGGREEETEEEGMRCHCRSAKPTHTRLACPSPSSSHTTNHHEGPPCPPSRPPRPRRISP